MIYILDDMFPPLRRVYFDDSLLSSLLLKQSIQMEELHSDEKVSST